MTNEQKKHVDAFEYWVKTNTGDGVSIIPESICKDIIAILRDKDGEQERRKADSCEGCKHRTGGDRFWICQKCRRQYEDKYEAERRTDD